MKLKFIYTIIVIIAVGFLLAGCSSGSQVQTGQSTGTQQASTTANAGTAVVTANADTSTQKTFTAAELSKFNGQNGNPAYVAVHGVVYDVSNVRQWRDGQHNGFTAGLDLTDAFDNMSPHNGSTLKNVPVVGKYVG